MLAKKKEIPEQNVFVVLVNCASWGLYTEKRAQRRVLRGDSEKETLLARARSLTQEAMAKREKTISWGGAAIKRDGCSPT